MPEAADAAGNVATEAIKTALAQKTLSMSDEQFVEFLFKRVVADAENRSLAREHQRWTILFLVIPVLVAVIGFIGFTSFSDLRSSIRDNVMMDLTGKIQAGELSSQIATAVNQAVEVKVGELNNSIALARLLNLASQVRDPTLNSTMARRRISISGIVTSGVSARAAPAHRG